MFCRNCGSEINDNATFCSSCGVKVAEDTNTINANNTTVDSNNVTTNTINNTNTNTTDYNNSNYSNNSYNNYNNIPHNTNNKNNTKIIIIIAVVVLFLVILIGGGIFVANKIKLAIVDKIAQVEAQNINDIFNDTENTLDINDVFDDTENTLDIELAPGVEIITEEEKSYSVGDSVELVDGSSWYVLSKNGSNVTLLSSQYYGEKCYFGKAGGSNYYEQSAVKDIIDNKFLPELKSSISLNGGDTTNLKARIISVDDIRKALNIPSSVKTSDIEIENTYSWLYTPGDYWTSTRSENSTYNSVYMIQSWNSFGKIYEDLGGLDTLISGKQYYVRPVIETTVDNLK